VESQSGAGSATKVSLCVVLPTKDEEASIVEVVRKVRAVLSRQDRLKLAAVVVTDDSRDRTRELATAEGCIVIPGGAVGLGVAMLRGLHKALEFAPEVIVSIDSDGQVDLEELPRFLAPVLDGSADFVLGSRFLGGNRIRYRYPRVNHFGIKVLTWILRGTTGLPLTDSHGGIRVMRPEVIRAFDLMGKHTYVQETIIDAAWKGFRIVELATTWLRREHGGSRVISIPRYIARTGPALLVRAATALLLGKRRPSGRLHGEP
jgi:glycosyltransferase involved in cell wall biosynthesis